MVTGRGGMGSTKHGKSGRPPKSPKARFHMELDAKQNDRKAKISTCKASTMKELTSNQEG